MALRDLNEELYKRDGEIRQSVRPNDFDPMTASSQDNSSRDAFQGKMMWKDDGKKGLTDEQKKAWKIGFLAAASIIIVALLVVVVVKIQQSAFGNDKVTVNIDGPTDVGGSEASRFVISYSNANRIALHNAEMVISYPENFHPEPMENMTIKGSSSQIHIGDVADHSKGKVEIRGKFYGSKGTLAYLKASLQYSPDNIGSAFVSESQLGITVRTSSLKLDIDAPLEMASGDRVEYRLDYVNMSDATLSNLRLKVEYPGGFHFQESVPKVSEGETIWYIGNLAPGQKGELHIVGSLDGSKNETKILKAQMGNVQGDGNFLSYSDAERLTKIVTSPLVITQTVNRLTQLNVNSGDVLEYRLQYRNEGEIGLRGAIVTLSFTSPLFDFSGLQLGGKGTYDSNRKIITWKASDIRELANLAPGQSGFIEFTIPVLGNIPIEKNTDKNFTLSSRAQIDSPDIPTPIGSNKIISSNTVNMKLNSKTNVSATAVYQDDQMGNTGPFPPEIGKETTYTMRWSLFNTVNDIDKARFVAYLAPGVRWTGKTTSPSENIFYDARTNQVVWEIGSVANGIGIITPAREIVFQVAVTPQQNQDKFLLGETLLTAHDVFTDQEIRAAFSGKSVGY